MLQDIRKSFENVHLDVKIYWILPATLWNSTTLTPYLKETWSQRTAASLPSANDLHNAGSSNHPEVSAERRLSRVDSIKNLLFSNKGGYPVNARRRSQQKKRMRSEEKAKVKFLTYWISNFFFLLESRGGNLNNSISDLSLSIFLCVYT